jgi:Zn finger protein HypA/HybF involved in hydrogenase expression
MSSSAAFFSSKPAKRNIYESRTTLDMLHQKRVQSILEKEKQLDEIKKVKGELLEQRKTMTNDIEYEQIENKLHNIEKEINQRSEKNEIYDYFLETSDILYNYYNIQDKIQSGEEQYTKRSTKSKPGSIFAVLESAASTEQQAAIVTTGQVETHRRDKLLEKYLQKVDPENARHVTNEFEEPYGECSKCNIEMIFSANEAVFTCTQCGYQEFVLIDSDKPSYKDPPREICYYAYKRINHFNEWLAQFQAKESTEIPQEVYDAILMELKKERILEFSTLKSAKIREILKKLKYNKYYEHVFHIMNRLNGQNAPVMSREIEEKLRFMFREIQYSFQKHCPKGRSNFLSYSYVLYKLCELLELDEYLPCFPLLKNRDKLYIQDKIWQKICADLNWEFIRSI